MLRMQSVSHSNSQVQQPFFKTSTSSTSYFLKFDKSGSKTASQSPAGQTNGSSLSQQIHVRPVLQGERHLSPTNQKEKEKELPQDPEKMQSLHSKLHQEAEKIRQWKTSTEIELKQKERKLVEASQKLETQRNAILELQLHNERISSKLQDEMARRQEVEQKINSTRIMCNALKDHFAHLSTKIKEGENDRDELKLIDKQRIDQYQEMLIKFRELEIDQTKTFDSMKAKAIEQKDRYEDQISNLHNQIHNLTTEGEEIHKKVVTMESSVIKKNKECEDLKNERENLKDRINKMDSAIVSMQVTMENTEEMLLRSKEETKTMEDELNFSRNKLEDYEEMVTQQREDRAKMEETYQEDISSLKQQIASLQDKTKDKQKRLEECTNKYAKCIDDIQALQKHLESVVKDKDKIIKELEKLRDEKAAFEELKHEFKETKNDISTLQKEKAVLLKETAEKERIIRDLKQEIMHMQDNQKVQAKNEEEIRCLLDQENSMNSNLQQELQQTKNAQKQIEQEKKILENTVENLEDEIKEKEKDRLEMQEDYKKLQERFASLEEKWEKLNEYVEEQHHKTTALMQQEDTNAKKLKHEIEEKEKRTKSLEKKNESLQTQLGTKTKTIKELQQEMKSLKSKMTSQTKQSDKLENQASSLLDQVKNKNEEILDLERQLKECNDQQEATNKSLLSLEQKIDILNKKIKEKEAKTIHLEEEAAKSKELSGQAEKDKDEAKKMFEQQMAELCSTLEKYKMENEKIVAQKDRELDQMRQKLKGDKEESTRIQEKKMKEMKEKIALLQKDLGIATEKQKTLTLALDQEKETVISLQKRVSDEKENLKSPRTTRKGKEHQVPKSPEVSKKLAGPTEGFCTPQTSALTTPKGVGTPTIVRSILKGQSGGSKKRRVVFAESDLAVSISSSDDEECLPKTNMKKLSDDNKKGDMDERKVPSRLNKPNVRQSPKPATWKDEESKKISNVLDINKASSLKPVSRGKPVRIHKKMKMSKEDTEELTKFKDLFPDIKDTEKLLVKTPAANQDMYTTSGGKKKTPFKSKLKEIKPLIKKKATEDDILDWFDTDVLFGFGECDQ